jgi:hypothetical protein
MLMTGNLTKFKAAVRENRRALIWLFATYVPAVFVAGYGGYWLFRSYILAFIVGGIYLLWLMIIWGRIVFSIRES